MMVEQPEPKSCVKLLVAILFSSRFIPDRNVACSATVLKSPGLEGITCTQVM